MTILITAFLAKENKNSKFYIPILFIVMWLFLGIYVPFSRSLLSSPVMHIRYYAGVYPALTLIMACSFLLFNNSFFKSFVLSSFIIVSLLFVFCEKGIYVTQTKCDWRAMGKFFADNNSQNYPLRDINPQTNILELDYKGAYSYYPTFYGKKPILMTDDAFLYSEISGIWIFESWWMPGHEDFVKRLQARNFKLTKEFRSFGSYAMLYEK
ncbi:MAG: hypothetical protein EAZ27_09660 [Cytophagales bacterium]|nr:MAG: hypothetical protein EAZ27_09660 [Cytophagales bacterium]